MFGMQCLAPLGLFGATVRVLGPAPAHAGGTTARAVHAALAQSPRACLSWIPLPARPCANLSERSVGCQTGPVT